MEGEKALLVLENRFLTTKIKYKRETYLQMQSKQINNRNRETSRRNTELVTNIYTLVSRQQKIKLKAIKPIKTYN